MLDAAGGVDGASVLRPPLFAVPFRGRGGSVSLMSAAESRQSVTIPAVPEQVRAARDFVARVLGESHAHVDLALLLASEL
jgi:hypothetical protein